MPSTGATGYASAPANAAPSASLTDFSFLVDLDEVTMPSEWVAALLAHGSAEGIRVFSADGSTEYARDIINVSYSAATGQIRFQAPGATSSAITVRVYPDATGTYADTDTFGRFNAYPSHLKVYHTYENGSFADRTSNGFNGTNDGTTSGTGQIGDGRNLDGTNDRITTSYTAALGNFTAMAWFYAEGSSGAAKRILDKSYDNGFWLGRNYTSSGSFGGGVREAGDPYGRYVSLPETTWNHIASRRSSTTHHIIGNGGAVSTSGTVSSSATDSTALTVGQDGAASWWDGLIDEVQIHDVALSDAWIAYEFSQTDDNAGFWGTWAWTAIGGGTNYDVDLDFAGEGSFSNNRVGGKSGSLSFAGESDSTLPATSAALGLLTLTGTSTFAATTQIAYRRPLSFSGTATFTTSGLSSSFSAISLSSIADHVFAVQAEAINDLDFSGAGTCQFDTGSSQEVVLTFAATASEALAGSAAANAAFALLAQADAAYGSQSALAASLVVTGSASEFWSAVASAQSILLFTAEGALVITQSGSIAWLPYMMVSGHSENPYD